MATNDIYENNGLTFTPTTMSFENAERFMRNVDSYPTHPRKRFIAKDSKTGSRVYFNHTYLKQ